ncbi:formate/nitrite transporter [Peptoniphilus sp. ING2-D1G]|nr:formate/nitrite transporter [Peptoniphilus sp. ING2-D1G]
MYSEALLQVNNGAIKKYSLYTKSRYRYLIGSIMAGFFIGLGILLMGLSISIFGNLDSDFVKISNGVIFSAALSLVIMAGGELFTSNIMVLSSAAFTGRISGMDAIKVCALSYIGNFLGALLVSVLYMGTGAKGSAVGDAIVGLCFSKTSADVITIFFRGIMCNILVCTAVLCCMKMKNEAAKLIMIVWCILTFVGLGFEHSIANMMVFSLGSMISKEVTIGVALHNLIPATIGNIVGGIMVSGTFYTLGKQ